MYAGIKDFWIKNPNQKTYILASNCCMIAIITIIMLSNIFCDFFGARLSGNEDES